MKKLSVMLCLIALLAFTLNGCGGSGTTDTSYYGGGDSGGTTTTSPTVTSCTTNLTPGQTCSINGSGFGSSRDSGSSSVSFVPQVTGGTTLTATVYLSWSDTAITCITPSLVTGIQYVVVVNRYTSSGTLYSSTTYVAGVNGTTGTAATTAPAVTSQAPNPATAGASVTLTGTNFPTSGGYILVNGTAVSATFTSTTAVFTIPAGTATGATVTLGGGTGGATTYSLVIGGSSSVQITNINPSTVPAATAMAITITGTGFGATQGTSYVSFGTTQVTTVTSWSATSIVLNTPATLAAGTTAVTVTVGGVASNSSNLTVAAAGTPVITNITPASVVQGGTVTITGVNFGSAQGTGFVTFGSVNQTAVTGWTGTTISCVVPVTTPAGTVNVTVTPSSGTASAAYQITVTTTPVVTGAWHSPASAISGSLGSTAPADPILARTFPNGNIIAIYIDQTSSPAVHNALYANYFLASTGTWAGQAQIDNPAAATAAQTPSMDMDTNGNVMVVWQQLNGASDSIYFRYYTYSSGTWAPSAFADAVLDKDNKVQPGGGGNPDVAFDSNGDAVCVWCTDIGANSPLLVANKYVNGAPVGTWLNTPVGIQNDATALNGPATPTIAFKYGSRVGYAGWVEGLAAAERGVYTRKVDTSKATWGVGNDPNAWANTASRIDFVSGTAGNVCNNPQIIFNSANNGFCIFGKLNGATNNVYAARYINSADQFSGPTGIANAINTSGITANTQQCAFLSDGNALMVWEDATFSIQASTWASASLAWSASVPIQALGGNADAVNPALATDASANAFCIYSQSCVSVAILSEYASRYSSGTWSRPTAGASAIIDGDTSAAVCTAVPAVTFNSSGNAWALFRQTSAGLTKVFCNRWY
ncbi:MAG: beta strand repeat-containing protein [Candidatus Xenobiia bacterium LiM19]